MYRNLHLAFSLYDDALATVYARLLHLHVWATLRCLQYRSGEYIVLYVCNFGLIMIRKALYFVIGFATIWQIMYTLTNSVAVAADPQETTPGFDGQRDSFVGWYMLFTGYVAWKATDAYTIADGSETKPEPPEGDEPVISAPTTSAEGAVTNQATITAETRARDAWRKRTKKVENWEERNRKLYGLLITAMPTWLRTSLFNSHSGDGRAAIVYLQSTFDAGEGKGNDHAYHLERLTRSVIEPRREIDEKDLQSQYDWIMTCKTAIERTKEDVPGEATLIAFFDNALPHSYSSIRQLVRRQKHDTLLKHYTDYQDMVRGELASRRPTPSAYNANLGNANPVGTRGRGRQLCVRCGLVDCPGRRQCTKPPTQCPLCGGDHLGAFCPKAVGRHRRSELTSGALKMLMKEMTESLARRGQPAAAAASTAPAAASAAPPAAAPANRHNAQGPRCRGQ